MTSTALRFVLAPSLLLFSVGAVALATGCSDLGTHNLAIEGSEQVTAGVTTADEWAVSFEQFVVVVHDPGLIEDVAGDAAWIREVGVSVWDVTQALGDDEPLSRQIRAKSYDGADFRIGPASDSGYAPVAGNVDAAVLDAATDDDWSIHVVGSATNAAAAQTVTFDWTFTTNTLYRCEFDGDEVLELGAAGDETTVLEILGETLLGAEPMFGAIAAADADADGAVTQAELESAGLWDAIESASAEIGGVRGVGACPAVD